MHVTINGKQAIDASITLPLTGPWVATVSAHAVEAISGACTISIADGAITLVGWATASGLVSNRAEVRVVGGLGRYKTELPGRCYTNIQARQVVGDMLTEAGETLSAAASAGLLDTALRHWARAAGTLSRELRVLTTTLGVNWRTQRDGSTWVGTDAWAQTALADDYTVIEDAPKEQRIVLAHNAPIVFPGETFRDQHVVSVEHMLKGPTLRTQVGFA